MSLGGRIMEDAAIAIVSAMMLWFVIVFWGVMGE